MLGVGGQMSTQSAKQAWLARLDAPTWGAAANTLANVASEAAYMAHMEEECVKGDDVACDELSREEEAKRAWLASLDLPTWGKCAAEVAQLTSDCNAGFEAACEELSREEEAKRAWLARQEIPAWGPAAAAPAAAPPMPELTEMTVAPNVSEEEAKQRWLARNAEAWGNGAKMSEGAAKRAWLTKQETPTWRRGIDVAALAIAGENADSL